MSGHGWLLEHSTSTAYNCICQWSQLRMIMYSAFVGHFAEICIILLSTLTISHLIFAFITFLLSIQLYQCCRCNHSFNITLKLSWKFQFLNLIHCTPVERNIWPSASNIIPEFTNHKLAFCCSLVCNWYLVGSAGPDIPSGGCMYKAWCH